MAIVMVPKLDAAIRVPMFARPTKNPVGRLAILILLHSVFARGTLPIYMHNNLKGAILPDSCPLIRCKEIFILHQGLLSSKADSIYTT